MKRNMMQCKDIEDAPLLAFIARRQYELFQNVCSWDFEPPYSDLPEKLLRAKLANLIGRGFVDGCACGCGGSFELTYRGVAFLATAYGDKYDFDSIGMTRPYEDYWVGKDNSVWNGDRDGARKAGKLLSGVSS